MCLGSMRLQPLSTQVWYWIAGKTHDAIECTFVHNLCTTSLTHIIQVTTRKEINDYKNWVLYASAASWYAYHIGYLFTLASVKLSILVFYLSFATQRTFRILVYIAIVIVSAYTVAMILVNALQCPNDPLYALSPGILKNRGAGHCIDLRVIFYIQAGFNMLSDLFILVLPLPLLFRLHMHRLKRLSLLAVFTAGLLVPIASGIRIWGLYIWATAGSKQGRYTGGYIIFWYVKGQSFSLRTRCFAASCGCDSVVQHQQLIQHK